MVGGASLFQEGVMKERKMGIKDIVEEMGRFA